MFGLGLGLPFIAIRGAGFWDGGNAFLDESEYNASTSGGKRLLTTAVAQALGWTNSQSTANPPSTVFGRDGTLQYAAHNLFLQSAAPATQTITVVSGLPYTIWATGTGSIVLSSGGSGTLTLSGNTNSLTFTTSGTSLICTVSGTLTFAQLNRGSVALDPVTTTSAAVYAPPITFDRGATQNQFLNSATAATQTITTVSGTVYTISGLGTGTITLSSGGSGVLSPASTTMRAGLTFTASGTSTICTVAGSVTQVNFNAGYQRNYLETTGSILYSAGTPTSQNLVPNAAALSLTLQTNVTLSASGVSDPNGGTGAKRYDWTSASNGTGLYLSGSGSEAIPIINTSYVLGFWIRTPSGSGTVSLCDAAVTEATTTGLSVTTTWSYVRHRKTATTGALQPWLKKEAGSPTSIEVYLPHVYEGQADLALANVSLTTGTPISVYPQLEFQLEPTRTRETLQPRDLTQAAWSKTNCTATKNQTGIDGVANSCTLLTATTGSFGAYVTQNITSASANRVIGLRVRAISSAAVNFRLTVDAFSNVSSTFTATPQGQTFAFSQSAVTNPVYGIGLQNNGDSIAVDFVQGEQGTVASSPIWGTESAAQTRSVTQVNVPAAMVSTAGPQTTVVAIVPALAASGSTQMIVAAGSSGQAVRLDSTAHGSMNDGTNSTAESATRTSGVPSRIATRYTGSVTGVSVDGGTIATGTFDGSMGSGGAVGLGHDNAGGSPFHGGVRSIKVKYAAANDSDFQAASAGLK